jgi:ribokinase
MSCELAVVGAPFFDLTFEGLARVPGTGEEVVARRMHAGPGGTGMQAIGAARLGLATALVAPLANSGPSALLREMLVSEAVSIHGAIDGGQPPTTALLSTPEGVAMVTALSGEEPDASDVAATGAGAVLLSLGRLPLAPGGTPIYVVTGGLELSRVDVRSLRRLVSVRALVVNAAEAQELTSVTDPEEAARSLAQHVRTAVVTMGADGALEVSKDAKLRAEAPQVDVRDATGAGDLFAAAYVWADVRGAEPEARLAWACLYAGLSVRAPTALAGALRLDELLEEGAARGLRAPPRVGRG